MNDTPQTNFDLLTPPDAAALLGLSSSFLAKARCSGGGPRFVKLGRAIRYRRADLDAWLDARTRVSTSDEGAE